MLSEIDSHTLSEWMAFDNLKDDEFKRRIESEAMTEDERNAAIRTMLGG